MKYEIISLKGAHGQGTEEKFAADFAEKLNALVADGWELVNHEFPNGPNGYRWVALLKHMKMEPCNIAEASIPAVAKVVIPKNGDRAYTLYHATRYEGELADITQVGDRFFGKLVPTDGSDWGYHDSFTGLYVGNDTEIRWDEKVDMWYAPANWD